MQSSGRTRKALYKLFVRRILEPALKIPGGVRLTCMENKQENLLADLSLHHLDAVIMDSPATPYIKIKAHSHLLLETGISIFGSPRLHEKYHASFPHSLDGAPFLLPTSNTALRRSLDEVFKKLGVSPLVTGEFEDLALLESFGELCLGLFPAPSLLSQEIERQFQSIVLGELPEILEKYYAITVERKIRHPVVAAICGE